MAVQQPEESVEVIPEIPEKIQFPKSKLFKKNSFILLFILIKA